jgi:hypothetical protein
VSGGPAELTDTIRACPAVASASYRHSASAKWPRWLVANVISQPSGVRRRSGSITPALLMSRLSGPVQFAAKAATDAWPERSSRPTRTALPVVAMMPAAVWWPAVVLRTARVTSAPALASARAVSAPMPDEPPVAIARLPDRSMPSITSAAVESKPNGVWMRVWLMLVVMYRALATTRSGTRDLVFLVVAGPGLAAAASVRLRADHVTSRRDRVGCSLWWCWRMKTGPASVTTSTCASATRHRSHGTHRPALRQGLPARIVPGACSGW